MIMTIATFRQDFSGSGPVIAIRPIRSHAKSRTFVLQVPVRGVDSAQNTLLCSDNSATTDIVSYVTVRTVVGKWLIFSSCRLVSSRLMLKILLVVIAVHMVEGEQLSAMRVDGDAEVDASVSVDVLTLKQVTHPHFTADCARC